MVIDKFGNFDRFGRAFYEPSVPWRYEHSRYDNLSDDKSYRNTNGL